MLSYAGWTIAAIALLYVMFSTRNLFKDVVAILSKIIQEVIKLAVTSISFFFRIISVVELYIVLLIDIFSGSLRQNAVTRLLSIALVALSVTSFYTTFTGAGYLITGPASVLIRSCLTFGIQAIMLGASLTIGKNSIVRAGERALPSQDSQSPQPPSPPAGRRLRLASLACAGVVYGLVYLGEFGRKWDNLLYLLGCLLVVVCLASLLPSIFSASCQGAKATLLLTVYFGTLLVSSFFSYNTVLNALYAGDERQTDNIVLVAEEVSSLLEDAAGCFDADYQAAVQTCLLNAIDTLKNNLETGTFHGANTLGEIAKSITFQTNYGTIQRLVGEYDEGNTTYARKMEIEYYLRSVLGPIFSGEIDVVPGIQSFRDILAYDVERSKCISDINLLTINLQKLEWDTTLLNGSAAALNTVSNFINRYIPVSTRTAINPSLRELGGLFEAVSIWKRFLHTAKDLQQEILSLNPASGNPNWDTSMQKLSQTAKALLNSIPPYFQSFPDDGSGNEIKPGGGRLSAPRLSLQLQRVIRSHRPGVNVIAQNLQAFVDTPQVSLFAALIAILIDTLILFVGMLLPRMIWYYKDTKAHGENAKYTPDELEEILGNVFNKPVREHDE